MGEQGPWLPTAPKLNTGSRRFNLGHEIPAGFTGGRGNKGVGGATGPSLYKTGACYILGASTGIPCMGQMK